MIIPAGVVEVMYKGTYIRIPILYRRAGVFSYSINEADHEKMLRDKT